MTRARPGSKWSIDGHVHALARVPAGGKFSGMMCACMSTIMYKPDQSIERQNRPGDLARLHGPERLVDVVEPPATRDHLVEQEPALAIELQVARNVGPETIAAHARGLHPALRANRHPRELDLRIRRHDADDRGGAPDGEALDRLPHERRVPDRFERVIHSRPFREGTDRLHGIVLAAVDDVRGAHTLGHLELVIEDVDADDLTGAADARALHDREPHASAAEDGDGLPGLEPR